MSTTPSQESAHKAAVALAEGARQTAQAKARANYSGLGVDWAVFDAAIKAADVIYMRAVITSFLAQGLGGGPRQTLHEMIGQDS